MSVNTANPSTLMLAPKAAEVAFLAVRQRGRHAEMGKVSNRREHYYTKVRRV